MNVSNEGNYFTLLGLSLLSPITDTDAVEENQEMFKLFFACIVMANLHFSVNFQKIIYIFFLVVPPSALTVYDKLKYWVRLKYI